MKHDWVLNEHGDIDFWRLAEGYHNGPECIRCGQTFCEHCSPECYNEECPSGQMDLGL